MFCLYLPCLMMTYHFKRKGILMEKLSTDHPHAFIINFVIDQNYNVGHDAIMKCIALMSETVDMDDQTWNIYSTFVDKLTNHYDNRKYRIYCTKIKEAINDKNVKLTRQLCSSMNNSINPKSLDDFVMNWSG